MTLATIVHIFIFLILFALACVVIQCIVNAIPYDRYEEYPKVYQFVCDEDVVDEEEESAVPVQPERTGKKSKFNQQFVAGDSVDSAQFSKRASATKKKQEAKPSVPSNIKEFTLPDGSVIHINTDKTEMEVNDASDYFK